MPSTVLWVKRHPELVSGAVTVVTALPTTGEVT